MEGECAKEMWWSRSVCDGWRDDRCDERGKQGSRWIIMTIHVCVCLCVC